MIAPGSVAITGIGSVSCFGPLEGLIGARQCPPRPLDWQDHATAFAVAPFRPAAVVPGLKTRRLDRLSAWSLVAAALALRDAQIDLDQQDRSRCAVVLGSGFGCIETTEAFFRTVAEWGYGKADPILFPDSLDNSPASHVAKHFALTGPNIALSCRGVSGEAALIEAASLLRAGEADLAIVMAGDTLTRPLYQWMEAAGLLSPRPGGFTPGEGLAALVMEPAGPPDGRGATVYATFERGAMGSDPTATGSSWPRDGRAVARVIRRALAGAHPSSIRWIVSCTNGSAALASVEAAAVREVFGSSRGAPVLAPKSILGEFDGSGVLRLVAALSGLPSGIRGLGMMLGASAGGGCAALLLNVP